MSGETMEIGVECGPCHIGADCKRCEESVHPDFRRGCRGGRKLRPKSFEPVGFFGDF